MAQITGYRKDRLGARIIALGNLLFLEDKFGASVRYLWPDAFESHDMSVKNKSNPIFDEAFHEAYIEEVTANLRPNIDTLTDLDQIRGRIGTPVFKDRLKQGELFLCNEGLQPVVFSNETIASQVDAFRRSMSRMSFSSIVNEVLEEALVKLKERGQTPLALHVRRGDVLDVEPWCHKNWVSKFSPDEFYEVVMDRPGVSALLFSDTPEAARRLAGNRKNAVTLDDLLDTPHLSEMQRDLVELLLMSRCEAVVAPSLSAFSSSAALISGMGVQEVPAGLDPEIRFAAYDKLLDRTLEQPESFYNPGDFAQSIGYAFGHALKEHRHKDMYLTLRSSMDQGQNYAFFKPLCMSLAIANGEPDVAVKLNQDAHKDPNLWPEDLMICDALGCVASHTTGDRQNSVQRFLRLYLERNKTVPHLDSLANYFFTFAPEFSDLFMVDDLTLKTFRYGKERERIFLFPVDETLHEGALNEAFPIWIPAADWPEMFEKKQIIKNITNEPGFHAKRYPVPKDIKESEVAHFRSGASLPLDRETLPLLSSLSVSLMLSGRLRRATSIMFHCRKLDPENPLYLKRLANRFRLTGETEKVLHNLERAMGARPDHIGVALSYAQALQECKRHAEAVQVLAKLFHLELLPLTYFKTLEFSYRRLKSKDNVKATVREASKRFPGHKIFEKQWKDKV